MADGNVLIFGGVDESGFFLNTGEIYQSTNRVWVPIPNGYCSQFKGLLRPRQLLETR